MKLLKYFILIFAFITGMISPCFANDASWPMEGQNPQHSNLSPYVGDTSWNLKWKYEIENMGPDRPLAIGSDGTIYVGTPETTYNDTRVVDGYLYALKPDGTLKWKFKAKVKSIAIGKNGVIYFGSGASVCAIDPNGKLKWQSDPMYSTGSIVVGEDDTVYVSGGGPLSAFDSNGNIKWTTEEYSEQFKKITLGKDGSIYLLKGDSWDPNKFLLSYDSNGELKWRYEINDMADDCPEVGPDGTIYVMSNQGLQAIDSNGLLKWICTECSYYDNLAIGPDGTLYKQDNGGLFLAIDTNGKIKWSKYLGSAGYGEPVVDANSVIFYDGQAIDASGNIISSNGIDLPSGFYKPSTKAIGSDGTIYMCAEGGVYAFGEKALDITSTYPENGAYNVPKDAVVTFNQNISWGFNSADISITEESLDGTVLNVFKSGDNQFVGLAENKLTFNLVWNANRKYTIKIPAGSVVNLSGNYLRYNFELFFYTGDGTSPTLASTNPTDGQQGVSLDSQIAVIFSEPINIVGTPYQDGTISIRNNTPDLTYQYTAFDASIDPTDNKKLILKRSSDSQWIQNTNYTVTLHPQSVIDNSGLTIEGDITFSFTTNIPLSIKDINVVTSGDAAVEITLGSLTDADGDNLNYSIVNGPTNGTLSPIAGNKVTYKPNEGYIGLDSFTFKANDGTSDSNIATALISTGNTPPTAQDCIITTNKPQRVQVTLSATDVDGDTLTYSIVSEPSNGILSEITGNTVTYTPNTGYAGSDSFTFKANDGTSYSNIATISLIIDGTPPQMLQTIPANGATNVLCSDIDVKITFNEEIQKYSSDGRKVTIIRQDTNEEIPINVLTNHEELWIQNKSGMWEPSTTYKVTVPNTVICDTIGNYISSDIIIEFTTVPENPIVTGVLEFTGPLNGSFNVGTTVTLNAQVANYDYCKFYCIEPKDSKPSFISNKIKCSSLQSKSYKYKWDTTGLYAGEYQIGIAGFKTGEGYTYSPTTKANLSYGFGFQMPNNTMSLSNVAKYLLRATAPGYEDIKFWYRFNGKDREMSEEITTVSKEENYINQDYYEVSWPDNHLDAGKYEVFITGVKNGVEERSNSISLTLCKDNSYLVNQFDDEPGWIGEVVEINEKEMIYKVAVELNIEGTIVEAYYVETNASQFGGLRDYKNNHLKDPTIDTSQNTWVNVESFLKESGYKVETLKNGRTLASRNRENLVFDLKDNSFAYLDDLMGLVRSHKITIDDYDTKKEYRGEPQELIRKRVIKISYPFIGGTNQFDFDYNQQENVAEMDENWSKILKPLTEIEEQGYKYINDTKKAVDILCNDSSEWGAIRVYAYYASGKDYTLISGPGGRYNIYVGAMSWPEWAKFVYKWIR